MNQNLQDIDELLLLQYLRGNADETLRARIEKWLNADSGNRNHLDRLESLWLETGKILPPPVAVDVDAAWNRMQKRMAREARHDSGIRNLRSSRGFWASAASVLLIAGIFTVYQLLKSPGQIQLASTGKVLVDSLPDGSKVKLNSHSTLSFPETFDAAVREVRLTGDAFFEVRLDSLQPFIVDAGMAKIMVLGTSFRVNTHPEGVEDPVRVADPVRVVDPVGVADPVRVVDPVGVEDPVRVVEVTVVSGRVLLFRVDKRSGDTLTLVINAGESGRMKAGDLMPVKLDTIPPDGLFWANQSFDFRSTELARVFSLLQKHFSVNIAVDNPAILDCRLTGSFVNEPVEKILQVIAASFGLKLENQGQNYQLSGEGCGKAGR
jgi:ferric-dicitrate binding protein FerR (iron transport regulator)